MALPRHDYRDAARKKFGKPGTSFPYGDKAFPTIIEERNAKKTETDKLPDFLSVHPKIAGAYLVEMQTDPGDDVDKNVLLKFETLPGPIFYSGAPDPDTNIIVRIRRRRVVASTQPAIITPGTVAITGISVANPTHITAVGHGFTTGQLVTHAGNTTTPTTNGQFTATVLDANHYTIPVNVTVSTSFGTTRDAALIWREIQATENVNVSIQIDSQVATESLSLATKEYDTQFDYNWPRLLKYLIAFSNDGISRSNPLPGSVFPNPCSIHFSDGYNYSAEVAEGMRSGPQGPTDCTIERTYHYGSPNSSAITVQRIQLSSGEVVCTGGSIENGVTIAIDASGTNNATIVSYSRSQRFNVASIPECLTGSYSTAVLRAWAPGIAGIELVLPPSTPTIFVAGDEFVFDYKVSPGRLGLYIRDKITLTVPAGIYE